MGKPKITWTTGDAARASGSLSGGRKTAIPKAIKVAPANERQYSPPKNPTHSPGMVSSIILGIEIA